VCGKNGLKMLIYELGSITVGFDGLVPVSESKDEPCARSIEIRIWYELLCASDSETLALDRFAFGVHPYVKKSSIEISPLNNEEYTQAMLFVQKQ